MHAARPDTLAEHLHIVWLGGDFCALPFQDEAIRTLNT